MEKQYTLNIKDMKQTAVEWLIKQLELEYNSFPLLNAEACIEAKEMEKEQLKQLMWDLTEIDMAKSNKGLIIDNRFDTYWNETFKSE
jgi:hypothetical protein